MPELPRLAVGTIQDQASPHIAMWALHGLLEQDRLQVQRFVGRAHSSRCGKADAIDGNAPRHLDSWLMPDEVCRELFYRSAKSADFSLVDGRYRQGEVPESDLSVLATQLDLPSLAVVDVAQLDGCRIPRKPEGVDGLLLDGVQNETHFFQVQTNLEALWGIPVVGGLDRLDSLRDEIHGSRSAVPSDGTIAHLTRNLKRYTSLEQLRKLAERTWSFQPKPYVFRSERNLPPVTIAVAIDDVFCGYFPETLEVLEHHGARVVDFSPLRDEVLPDGVDIVYFGCGQLDQYAEKLSDNMCMALSLRNHLCAGRRMIAEGAGIAYLSQQIELASGKSLPMVGVLPCIAKQQVEHDQPAAVEAQVNQGCWLAPKQSSIRGYRSGCWHLQPSSELSGISISESSSAGVFSQGPLVAFDFNLHLASQISLVRHFFRPRPIKNLRGSTNAIVW